MKFIKNSAVYLANAAEGNPVITTATIILFWLMFNVFEASIEKLIFGSIRAHYLDPVFGCAFIAYAAYAVYVCALFKSQKKQG